MNIHGNADSHIDALCHVIFDGTLYNGVTADTVTAAGGPSCPSRWPATGSSAGGAARHPAGARRAVAGAG